MNEKILVGLLSVFNFIFLVLLFTEQKIELGGFISFLVVISLILTGLSNLKQSKKVIGTMFLMSSALLSIHFFIK